MVRAVLSACTGRACSRLTPRSFHPTRHAHARALLPGARGWWCEQDAAFFCPRPCPPSPPLLTSPFRIEGVTGRCQSCRGSAEDAGFVFRAVRSLLNKESTLCGRFVLGGTARARGGHLFRKQVSRPSGGIRARRPDGSAEQGPGVPLRPATPMRTQPRRRDLQQPPPRWLRSL